MSLAAALAVLAASPVATVEAPVPRASSVTLVATASVTILRAARASEGNDGQAIYRSSQRHSGETTISFE